MQVSELSRKSPTAWSFGPVLTCARYGLVAGALAAVLFALDTASAGEMISRSGKSSKSSRKSSEAKANSRSEQSPASATPLRVEGSDRPESAKQGVPTPAKPLASDDSQAAESKTQDSSTPAKTYTINDEPAKPLRIDDDAEVSADEPTPKAAAETFRISDSPESDAPESDMPVSAPPKRPTTLRIEDANDKPEPTPAAKPQYALTDDSPDESAPASESESLGALVKFNPVKTSATTASARVRPSLIKLVQPQDSISSNTVAESAHAQLPAGGDAPTELPEEIQAEFKSITSLGTKIRAEGDKFPVDTAQARFQREGELYHALGYRREWAMSSYAWTAPGLCHYPLYFEEINLERHGYSAGLLQPFAGAFNFYGRIAILPYMMATNRPLDCQFTLGHYRPGSYAPFHLHHPPIRARGFVVEAATIAALFLIFP